MHLESCSLGFARYHGPLVCFSSQRWVPGHSGGSLSPHPCVPHPSVSSVPLPSPPQLAHMGPQVTCETSRCRSVCVKRVPSLQSHLKRSILQACQHPLWLLAALGWVLAQSGGQAELSPGREHPLGTPRPHWDGGSGLSSRCPPAPALSLCAASQGQGFVSAWF